MDQLRNGVVVKEKLLGGKDDGHPLGVAVKEFDVGGALVVLFLQDGGLIC
jgi:hypothetical protein